MNWGKGLIIGMSIFMLFIIAMVIAMFNQPADDYDAQYYEKGLSYDTTFNKERQVITDNAKPVLTIENNVLIIVFTAAAKG
ncbi:MAG: FixH family protein, partial [Mucilaginibacter sp.]